jgi:ring-1,2-phenylacetyl-CoA epoxidase subunit PaaC
VTTVSPDLSTGYLLALGDDALVLAQRCGQWVTRAPQLEEDVALANIGLDLLGQARALLTRAGELEGAGRSEDDLAYLRGPGEFSNVQLVELANGDFAVSMARLLTFSTYQLALYTALHDSTDGVLAGVAAKAVKEVEYHVDHATTWVLRLGGGTDLSRAKMQAGLAAVRPYTDELFDGSFIDQSLLAQGVAVDPAGFREQWQQRIDEVVSAATLHWPAGGEPAVPVAGALAGRTPAGGPNPSRGGRCGEHTPALAELLEELQALHRAHPGVAW